MGLVKEVYPFVSSEYSNFLRFRFIPFSTGYHQIERNLTLTKSERAQFHKKMERLDRIRLEFERCYHELRTKVIQTREILGYGETDSRSSRVGWNPWYRWEWENAVFYVDYHVPDYEDLSSVYIHIDFLVGREFIVPEFDSTNYHSLDVWMSLVDSITRRIQYLRNDNDPLPGSISFKIDNR